MGVVGMRDIGLLCRGDVVCQVCWWWRNVVVRGGGGAWNCDWIFLGGGKG